MDSNRYREFLLSNIRTASSASGGRVINCRCFNCPDSSDPRSKHFYISIPQSNDEPSLYYCHKCHCSCVVTHQKLIEWGIYNEQIAIELHYHNENCSFKTSNSKYYNKNIYKLFNSYISQDDISLYKLNYINNRIGTNLNFEDIKKLKIVLNLYDILKSNNINNLSRDKNIVDQLDSNFLGFISIDNAFLNMRRLCDEGKLIKSIDKRYINYKIFDKYDTSERFYTIPTEIDLNKPQRVKIHIAEGPFDILSIYQNLRNKEEGIYTSIAGSNYAGIALYFLNMFKLPYTEFHFYPDNDKFGSNDRMNIVANIIAPTCSPIYIHRNLYPNEKDFGVSKEKIQESIYRLK